MQWQPKWINRHLGTYFNNDTVTETFTTPKKKKDKKKKQTHVILFYESLV